jgi:flagellar operon protein
MINRVELPTIAPIATDARPSPGPRVAPAGTSFADVLGQQLRTPEQVRFSAHALQRLGERGIVLTRADHQRIESAVDQAAAKGARESLLLMDRLALVVNVPNRTIITVVPQENEENAVFTNIDSVVVMGQQSPHPSSRTELRNGPAPFAGSPRVAD